MAFDLDRWCAGESIASVLFKLGDAAKICEGLHSGVAGAVASLLSVQPVTQYIVETSPGLDVEVLEQDLEIVAT